MRMLTWNVGHQTRSREIPSIYADAVAKDDIDVVALTEYVHVEGSAFAERLRSHGYQLQTSVPVPRQNQVLIASRRPCATGREKCDHAASASPSNWLHVRVDDTTDVVGFRVPIIQERGGRTSYWRWLREKVGRFEAAPAILFGDLNAQPRYSHLKAVASGQWRLVTPDEGWSFRNKRGATYSIDHAIVNDRVNVLHAEYLPTLGDVAFAGASGAYSDHAALRLVIST